MGKLSGQQVTGLLRRSGGSIPRGRKHQEDSGTGHFFEKELLP